MSFFRLPTIVKNVSILSSAMSNCIVYAIYPYYLFILIVAMSNITMPTKDIAVTYKLAYILCQAKRRIAITPPVIEPEIL